ncbi:MAG: hypothetical protein HQK99_15840, partial [Nitrospirae bacterium]|nr:hypothetical protein [Nitrospirota bacterium]
VPGSIEIIKTGEFSSLTVTLITVVGDARESYVLIAIRGERSIYREMWNSGIKEHPSTGSG